jgi:hypothetical protein
MIRIKIADPLFPELSEYNRLLSEFKGLFPHVSVTVTRRSSDYAMSTACFTDSSTGRIESFFSIYPHSPNAAVGQVKADIMSVVQGIRSFGVPVEYIDSVQEPRESLHITRARLSGCVSIKQMVSMLEDANHERLPEVLSFIESKRASGGRPSKRSVVDLIFSGAKEEKRAQPMRTGLEWAQVKSRWKDRFHDSKFAKTYKSLDEFCTFATDQECSQ